MAAFLHHGGLQPSEFDRLTPEDTVALAEELDAIVKREREEAWDRVEVIARAAASAPRLAL